MKKNTDLCKYLTSADLVAMSHTSALASVNVSEQGNAGETYFDSQISATDLINSGQPSFGSAHNSVAPSTYAAYHISGTHDGASASWNISPADAAAKNTYYDKPTVLTYTFNLDAGTGGNPSGYDISGIKVFAGWNNGAFVAQEWTLKVATVANPTVFVDIKAVKYTPPGGSKSSLVSLTDTSGIIASGISAVRFDSTRPSIVFREIDVIGLPSAPDQAGPTMIAMSPADDASGVVPVENLSATFDEQIKIGTGNVTIKNLDLSTEIVIPVSDAQIVVSGAVLKIDPSAVLAPFTNYSIQIDAGAIQDFAGNPFAGISDDTVWNFTTGEPDLTPPTITTLSPSNQAGGVLARTNLIATFSEAIELSNGSITLQNLSTATQTVISLPDARVSLSGAVLTITPSTDLDFESNYAVRISAGTIVDLSGNPFAGIADDTTWCFTTAAVPQRIMCVGDSITAGYTNNPGWSVPFQFGYRSGLYTRLTNAGYSFQYVGASEEPWNGVSGYPSNIPSPDLRMVDQDHHRGYGSKQTSYVLANIATWLTADNPDVVLIMIGINDTDRVAARDRLNSIVQTIVTNKPNASVIVAQITPYSTYTQSIVDYNTYIRETMVPAYQAQGKRVSTVDQYANFGTNSTIDTTAFATSNHPNGIGYDRMAQTWFTGIQAAEYVRWTTKYPGTDLTDPAADADGDGMSNQQEFAFGLDPLTGVSINPIHISPDLTNNTFSYTRHAASALNYTVWTSVDLKTWAHDTGATQSPGIPVNDVQTVTVTLSAAPVNGRLFMRVSANGQ